MNNTNKLLIGAVVAALVLTVIPSATAAAAPNSGTFVKAGDSDISYKYAGAPGFAAICFVDLNNDGGQQPTEPLYLSKAACAGGKVAAGDIRLTAAFGKVGGTSVTGSDDDYTRNYAAPATAFGYKFFDADGNGFYNPGDVVYVGIGGPVAINDVSLNGANAFTRVSASSPNYNTPTCSFAAGACAAAVVSAVGGKEQFFNSDGIAGYGIADTVYLTVVAAPVAPTVGDIRLTPLGTVYKGGTTVTGSDSDVTVTAVALVGAGLCFVDNNGDLLVSAGEPLYLQFTTPGCGANSVSSGDYRVIATAGRQGGTLVGGNDDDFSRNTIAAPGAPSFGFYDADGSGGFSSGDQVYLDTNGNAKVDVNDVAITGSAHNTQVTSTSSGLNNGFGAAIAFTQVGVFNADGLGAVAGAVTSGDYLYLLPPGTATPASPGVNFVRLTTVGSFAPGSWVQALDNDATVTTAGKAFAAFCYTDVNADGIQQPTEPVYLSVAGCAGGVKAGDVRVTAADPYQAGTIVKGSDDDFSRALATPPGATGQWAVYDQDASGAYTNGEPVYVDFSAAAPCAVTPNDIAVTVTQFVRITASSSGINSPLFGGALCASAAPVVPALATGEMFGEADGIAGYTTGDVVYLDMDASGLATGVTVGDVRLTAVGNTAGQIGGDVGGSVGGGTFSGTSTVTSTTTSTSTTGMTTPPVSTPPASTPPASTPPASSTPAKSNTPGFELVALVGALAVALVLVRRKL